MDGRPAGASRRTEPGVSTAFTRRHALVAQRIGHLITDQGVGSSNLSGGTFATPHQGLEVGGVTAIGIWRSSVARVLGGARGRPFGLSRLLWIWRRLVARCVRDAEDGGSNPSIQTNGY